MSYIGNVPTTAAFPFDQFSGTGAATSFTLTYAPASATSILVAISGVMQNPNLYSVIGTTLSFSPAPPSGTNNISVLYLGLPVIGSSSPGNTAFLSSTDLTATAGQTVFASAGSYTPGFVQVYRNGARLGNADFTATNGTTITLASAATAGDLVTIEYYTLTSLVNALPLTGGTVTGTVTFNSAITGAAATFSGNVGVGTTAPFAKLNAAGATSTSATAYDSTSPPAAGQIDARSTDAYTTQRGGKVTFSGIAGTGAVALSVYGAVQGYKANASISNAGGGLILSSTSNASGLLTEAARIDDNQNLLVGTTSQVLSNTKFNLSTSQGNALGGMGFVNTNAPSTKWQIGPDNSANFVVFNGSAVGAYIANGGTSWTAYSDERLKTTLIPFENASAKVATLRAGTGRYLTDESTVSRSFLIAQDVQKVLPEAVDANNPDAFGLAYTDVIPLLVAAIKEQQTIITQLQADVAALKGQA